jgi:hypothetical protein
MLEKTESYSQIELKESGHVQLRLTTKILDDGKVISELHHRSVVTPKDDISFLPQNIQDACNAFWTKEVVDRFNASQAE